MNQTPWFIFPRNNPRWIFTMEAHEVDEIIIPSDTVIFLINSPDNLSEKARQGGEKLRFEVYRAR